MKDLRVTELFKLVKGHLPSLRSGCFAPQAVELLREVASVDPSVYEQQQQADAAGVRSVAGFIVELSDRWCPAVSPFRGCSTSNVMEAVKDCYWLCMSAQPSLYHCQRS